MGQSSLTDDRQVFQGTATASGTFVVTLPTNAAPYTDQLMRFYARAYATQASAGHLSAAGAFTAQAVYVNKNNVVSLVAAFGNSVNPSPSTNANQQTGSTQAADATVSSNSSLVFSIVSSQVTITYNNLGTGTDNVTVVVDSEMVGST